MSAVLLGGSLVAVLGLAAIAWLLGLGGGGIPGAGEAMQEAEASLSGFAAEQAFVSSDGMAALVVGRGGEKALLKRQGVGIAARRLALPVRAERIPGGVRIDSGERMFGAVTLRLSDDERDRLLTLL